MNLEIFTYLIGYTYEIYRSNSAHQVYDPFHIGAAEEKGKIYDINMVQKHIYHRTKLYLIIDQKLFGQNGISFRLF